MAEWVVIDIYRWTIGLLGSVLVILIVRYLENKKSMCCLKKVFIYFGKRSLEIYVVQQIILEYLGGKTFGLLVERSGKNFLVENTVLFAKNK